MIRCTICRLTDGRRAGVDAALRDGRASLQEISSSSGLSRSSLHRHRQHIDRIAASASNIAQPPTESLSVRQEASPIARVPQDITAQSPAARPSRDTDPAEQQRTTKEELLHRLQFLWEESLNGLKSSKEPIHIAKPDGSSVELPGDLRARTGFIREGRRGARARRRCERRSVCGTRRGTDPDRIACHGCRRMTKILTIAWSILSQGDDLICIIC